VVVVPSYGKGAELINFVASSNSNSNPYGLGLPKLLYYYSRRYILEVKQHLIGTRDDSIVNSTDQARPGGIH